MMHRGTVPDLSEVRQCFAELAGDFAFFFFLVEREGRRFSFLLVLCAEMAQLRPVPGAAQRDGEESESVAPGSRISLLCCIATVRTI